MFDILEKLRQKSDRQKKQVAFLAALSLAGIMFVVWLSVIYPNFRQKQSQEEKVASSEPSPLSTFTNQLSNGISAISEKFFEMKASVESLSANAGYYNNATNTPIVVDQNFATTTGQ